MRASVFVILSLTLAIQAQAAPQDYKRVNSVVNCTLALSDLKKMSANDQATMFMKTKQALENIERRLAAEVYRRELKDLAKVLEQAASFPLSNHTVDLDRLDISGMEKANKGLREDIGELKKLVANMLKIYQKRNQRWFRGRQTQIDDRNALQTIMVMQTQLFQAGKLLQIHSNMIAHLKSFDSGNGGVVQVNDQRRVVNRPAGRRSRDIVEDQYQTQYRNSSLLPDFFLWHFTFSHGFGWHSYSIDSVAPPGLLNSVNGPISFLENHGRELRDIVGDIRDTDGDGIVDSQDRDIDGDGMTNDLDQDDDGDGVLDQEDVNSSDIVLNDNDNSGGNDMDTGGGYDSPGGDSF